MVIQNEWTQRGQRAVGAATDLATGLFRGIQNIGPRIQAAQYKPIVEAFCAYTGLMAALRGRLQTTEIDGFKNFLLMNRQHPVFGGFPLDELVDKFKNYAVRTFLNETEIFSSVLNPIQKNSEEAQLIVAGCMSVIYADGHCDANELKELNQLAQRLEVNIESMAQNMGVVLPQVNQPHVQPQAPLQVQPNFQPQPQLQPQSQPQSMPRTSAFARTVSTTGSTSVTPVSSQGAAGQEKCSLCQGKGCVFCNQSGFKS